MSKAALHHNTSLAPVPRCEVTSTHYFEGVPFQSVMRDGEPWFVANEACAALRLSNPRDAITRLADDEKGVTLTDTPGGPQLVNVISEGALYTLMLRCRDAMDAGSVAYRFRRHVTGVVLPSIRRTGSYAAAPVPAHPFGAAMLQALQDPHAMIALAAHHAQGRIVAEQRAKAAEATVEAQQPMVEAFHAFLDDEGLCCLSTAAAAIEAPHNLFFAWARERGFLFDRDGFLQARADLRKDGYFKLRTVAGEYHRMKGHTMVTRAGLVWLRHRWLAGPGKVIALQAAVAAKQASFAGI